MNFEVRTGFEVANDEEVLKLIGVKAKELDDYIKVLVDRGFEVTIFRSATPGRKEDKWSIKAKKELGAL